MTGPALRLAILALLAAGAATTARADLASGEAAYDAGRPGAARAIWVGLARAGDASAAYRLGTLFELGDGVAVDPAMAYCWYRRAAAGGIAAAAFNVAVMNDSGRGTPHDAAAAASWYGRAAAFGFARAEFNLGLLYEAGEGVPRNPAIAASWYRLAAGSGLTAAAERLAKLHATEAPGSSEQLRPVRLDAPAEATGADVPLTWAAVPQGTAVSYYVEVVATDWRPPRAVFSATTDLSAALARLPPGGYAGRVFALASDSSHYAVGDWTRFGVGPAQPLPVCASGR